MLTTSRAAWPAIVRTFWSTIDTSGDPYYNRANSAVYAMLRRHDGEKGLQH